MGMRRLKTLRGAAAVSLAMIVPIARIVTACAGDTFSSASQAPDGGDIDGHAQDAETVTSDASVVELDAAAFADATSEPDGSTAPYCPTNLPPGGFCADFDGSSDPAAGWDSRRYSVPTNDGALEVRTESFRSAPQALFVDPGTKEGNQAYLLKSVAVLPAKTQLVDVTFDMRVARKNSGSVEYARFASCTAANECYWARLTFQFPNFYLDQQLTKDGSITKQFDKLKLGAMEAAAIARWGRFLLRLDIARRTLVVYASQGLSTLVNNLPIPSEYNGTISRITLRVGVHYTNAPPSGGPSFQLYYDNVVVNPYQ